MAATQEWGSCRLGAGGGAPHLGDHLGDECGAARQRVQLVLADVKHRLVALQLGRKGVRELGGMFARAVGGDRC